MVIKLSSVRVDLERELKGDWVDYPDWPGVSFNVSSILMPAYVIERDLLAQRLARQYKQKPIPPDVSMVEIGKLFHKHILHGWRGIDEEYSREKAAELLSNPEYRKLIAAVQWCANQISDDEVEFAEETAKNFKEAFRDRLRREAFPEGSQDWLEEIADAYPDEEWVQRAAYPEGRFEYEMQPWHGLYWRAWNALRYDRPYGAMGGQGPIPYIVVSRYAEDHEIVGDDFAFFRAMLDAIDEEWLKHVAERDKEKDKDRQGKGEHVNGG